MPRRVARYGRLGPLYELAPRRAYLVARNLWLDARSLPKRLAGGPAARLPWMTLHNYGDGDFYESGVTMLDGLKRLLRLERSSQIVEIGCGSGRLAYPLSGYLNEAGGYVGFDVSKNALRFAERLVASRRPDFRFVHADLHSDEYNAAGTQQAASFRFPAAERSADAVVAISVFTHLLEPDAASFLQQIARVLKPEGRAYITAYVLNDEIAAEMANARAMMTMQRYKGPVWAGDLAAPEAATGYDEAAFLRLVDDAGLALEGDLIRGGWWRPQGAATYSQDGLLLRHKQSD